MITVIGATGNNGGKISEQLLGRGEKVRVMARNADRLKKLKEQGAEVLAGSVEDTASMAKAFAGASAAFIMIPPNYSAPDFRGYQNKVSRVIADAIEKTGLDYAVNLSSVGAHLEKGTGPIAGLHDHEERLNMMSGLNVLHLRPTYFMENNLWNIPLIKNQGINGGPLHPDLRFSMIATQDIAAEAVERLLRKDFKGHTVKELLGPRDVTMKEVTAVIGKAIGKPELPYVQFPYADTEKALLGMGFSADAARLMVEMNRGFNDGVVKPSQKRSLDTSTKTSIEEFAAFFAQAYRASAN